MTTRSRASLQPMALWVLVLALSALLRLETLYQRPLWYDEIYTSTVVSESSSLADIWAASGRDRAEHPLLYYAAAYAVSKLSSTEKAIRIPACIAGILSIPLLAALAYRLFGVRAALLSALLLALSVYHIEYSQDARPYALLTLCAVAAVHGLLSFVRARSLPGLALLALSLLASLYAHHTARFLCGAVAVSGLAFVVARWWKDRHFPLWLFGGLAGAAVVVALGFSPQIAHLRAYLASSNLERTHTLALSGHFFVELFNRWSFGTPWGALSIGLLALGLARGWKSHEVGIVMLPWISLPFLVFGYGPFGKFFDIRFAIVALPPFHCPGRCRA